MQFAASLAGECGRDGGTGHGGCSVCYRRVRRRFNARRPPQGAAAAAAASTAGHRPPLHRRRREWQRIIAHAGRMHLPVVRRASPRRRDALVSAARAAAQARAASSVALAAARE
eukprot:4058976-Pleurochrysis_carterae.AAC.1